MNINYCLRKDDKNAEWCCIVIQFHKNTVGSAQKHTLLLCFVRFGFELIETPAKPIIEEFFEEK